MKFNKKFLLLTLGTVFFLLGFANLILLDKEGDIRYKNIIQQNIENEISQISNEHHIISNLIKLNSNNSFTSLNYSTFNPYYIYTEDSLIYWSSNNHVPTLDQIKTYRNTSLIEIEKNYFFTYKTEVESKKNKSVIVTLVPLYLQQNSASVFNKSGFNFAIFKNIAEEISINPLEDSFIINSKDNQPLFYVKPVNDRLLIALSPSKVTLFFFSIGLILILVQCFITIRKYQKVKKYGNATFILILTALLVRFWLYIFGLPWQLWNGLKSYSNVYQLGDELFTLGLATIVMALCCLWQAKALNISKYKLFTEIDNPILSFIMICVAVLWAFICYYILMYAYDNGFIKVEYNIQSYLINEKILGYLYYFFTLSIYFLGTHLAVTILYQINKNNLTKGIISWIFALTIAFLLAIYYKYNLYILGASLIYILVCYIFNLPKYLYILKFQTFLYFLCLSFVFSLFTYQSFNKRISPQIVNHKIKEEVTLLINTLNETKRLIERNKDIYNELYQSERNNTQVINYIKENILNDILKKHQNEFEIYNSNSAQQKSKIDSIRSFLSDVHKVSNGIYFYEENNMQLKFTLWAEKDSSLILIKTTFVPNNKTQLVEYSNPKLNYSYFDNNDKLITTQGDSTISKNIFKELNIRESIPLNVPALSDLQFKPLESIIKNQILSKYSLYFLFSVLCVINLLLLLGFVNGFRLYKLNFSSKIQFYLNLALVIPITFIVTVTLFTVINSFGKEQNKTLVRNAYNIANILSLQIQNVQSGNLSLDDFKKELRNLSITSDHDILIYSKSGSLKYNSSTDYAFSKYINPAAYSALEQKESKGILTYEKRYGINYKAVYTYLNSNDILAIPYLYSDISLEKRIEEILSAILVVFFILFIILLLLSFVVSFNLTRPLQFLTNKFQDTGFLTENEKLYWKHDDEIGKLIQEYNRMIEKLEESKEALAQSEKQAAWKNMTQQLAHEIKNPLTPMKLSIQQLQRTLPQLDQNNLDKFNTIFQRLNTQIDNISDIVNSFSEFANLPLPKTERFNLTASIHNSHSIQSDTNSPIVYNPNENDIYAIGNQEILIKTIKNFTSQLLELCPKANVKIDWEIKMQKILIHIYNANAESAPNLIKYKSLEENSNLDLQYTILKRGIEHTGGKTWHETQQNNTLHFYIELPKAKN